MIWLPMSKTLNREFYKIGLRTELISCCQAPATRFLNLLLVPYSKFLHYPTRGYSTTWLLSSLPYPTRNWKTTTRRGLVATALKVKKDSCPCLLKSFYCDNVTLWRRQLAARCTMSELPHSKSCRIPIRWGLVYTTRADSTHISGWWFPESFSNGF